MKKDNNGTGEQGIGERIRNGREEAETMCMSAASHAYTNPVL